MKMLLILICMFSSISYAQYSDTPTDGLIVGRRIIYSPDGTRGDLVSINFYTHTVCVKFDLPRYDGAYQRCGIRAGLVYHADTRTPTDGLVVGRRIIYSPDGTRGDLLSINYFTHTVCVKFDLPRSNDGAYERCGIKAGLVYHANTRTPTDGLIAGERIVYLPDGSRGDLLSINYYTHTVCVKFDYPRYDGAYERCGIKAGLISHSNRY